jgi:hypothetical protein
MGRFISADSIVPHPDNPQTLNRCSYVLNNPIKFVDPTGHAGDDPNDDWGGWGENTPASLQNALLRRISAVNHLRFKISFAIFTGLLLK